MKQATDQDLQLGKWIGGAALGALVMYMLDPDRGAPRRAVSGKKLRQLGRQTGEALDKVMHGAGAHAAQFAPLIKEKANFADNGHDQEGGMRDDQGTPRSGAMKAMLRKGADSLQRALSSAPRSDSLSRYQSDSGSGYRAKSEADHQSDHRSGYHPERDHGLRDASPASSSGRAIRGTTLAGAGVLGLAGLAAPRSPIGIAMGLAGLALLVREMGKRPLHGLLSGRSGAQAAKIEKTIHIDAAPEKVFDLFTNYENFPRFMANVIEVRDLGEDRSHWVVKGPAGSHFAWNAVLTEHSRPHRLAWESEPGADVQQSGSILFEPIHSGTRVTVRMAYQPPAGAVGHALASLLGSDPKRQMDEDLERMKSLVERGATTQAGNRHGASAGKFLH